MKAPEFWSRSQSTLGAILSPLGLLYGLGGQLRRAMASPARVDAKVICIGNLVAGGAGKTPTALAVAELLGRDGVAFLTRGYGGRLAGPVRVDPETHTVSDVGDEALLLARAAPTWVSRDRVAGARAAVAAGAGVIIMDDGHQNPALAKDAAIVVVDAATGFGNGRIIPAGPLRESVADGLSRADAIVMIGKQGDGPDIPSDIPVFPGRIVPTPEGANLSGRRVVAFAGIGRPEKFFETLADMGCDIVARYPFADHHVFGPEEIMELCEAAAAQEAVPVTTEKDAVRLPDDARNMVDTLPVRLEWEQPDRLSAFLAARIG